MRLVLRLIHVDMNRADYACRCVFGGEQDSFAASDTLGRPAPEPLSFSLGDWVHEANRRAALHAVYQHLGKPLDLALIDGIQTTTLNGASHFISSRNATVKSRLSRPIAHPGASYSEMPSAP